MTIFQKYKAKWIWSVEEEKDVNQYVEFRREFHMDSVPGGDVRLYISVDSDYAVWINGRFIDCGQYSDYPDEKAYDTVDIAGTLKEGMNSLCILAYYRGKTCFTYKKGCAGLLYVLEAQNTVIVSDALTRCRKSRTYTGGEIYEITPQLSYGFAYDASLDDAWYQAGYGKTEFWDRAAIVAARETTVTVARPVDKLILHKKIDAGIIAQGYFFREHADGITVAEMMQTDYLSARSVNSLFANNKDLTMPSKDGLKFHGQLKEKTDIYVVVDLGSEEVGFLSLEADAEEGTIIDIAYGEHLDDMRVRAYTGGRNFAFRYICGKGRQEFTYYFRRLGCRYIELHISNMQNEFCLYYAGLKPVEYPLENKGQFLCPDSLHNKISEVCVKTLRLCMHEHYEDCPWREQALYGMDSRNQALCGYYCFGEYDFPQASFELLGKSLREDGYLELVAPSEYNVTIPSFSMAWIIEVYEFYLYSGRVDAAEKFFPWVKKMVEEFASNRSPRLLMTPKGKRYWHFYEWAEGLEGLGQGGFDALKEDRFDAPLNLFFCIALDGASQLAEAVGDKESAKRYKEYAQGIRCDFHDMFWDESMGVYATYAGQNVREKHFSELTQSLALYAGVCPQPLTSALRKRLSEENSGLVKVTLSHSFFKFEALLGDPYTYAELVFQKIDVDWGYMLYNGATSFWETIQGGSDFDNAGSMCHGWSAIPLYFYYAYILGVKPVAPGFKEFTVNPISGVFSSASGKVPTPYGDITVNWNESKGNLDCAVSSPSTIRRIL